MAVQLVQCACGQPALAVWSGPTQVRTLAQTELLGSGSQRGETHRFAWVDVRQVSFELLHRPVLETVDGLVIVLLVGCPDDEGNRIVHDTLIHGSKAFVSVGRQMRSRLSAPVPPPPLAGHWLQSSWECRRFFRHHQTASTGKHVPVINLHTGAARGRSRGTQRLPLSYILECREVIFRPYQQLLPAKLQNLLAANSLSL